MRLPCIYMLKGEKFDAFALRSYASGNLCFLTNVSMLTGKRNFAF